MAYLKKIRVNDNEIIEEIARQFNIPLEEAKERMKDFIGEIPQITNETRQKIEKAKRYKVVGDKIIWLI